MSRTHYRLRRGASRVHARLTRNGMHMAVIAVFALLGGSVRGFNLLVVLAGLMVGVLIVQWRFCRGLLPGLRIDRFPPSDAYAGRTFRMGFALTNARSWLPAWTIRVEDRIRSKNLAGRVRQATCSVGLVDAGATEHTYYECTIMRRGRYRFGPPRLSTGFPLGLVHAWKEARNHATLTVFPRLAPLAPRWIDILRNRRSGMSESRHTSGPSEGDFFGIRQWQTGDSRRWIHWRTTARVGHLAVRQFEQRSRTQVTLLLDPFGTPASFGSSAEDDEDEDLEWAISVAAAMLVSLASHSANRVAFAIADASPQVLSSHRVTEFRRAALTALASVKPSAAPRLSATLAMLLRDGSPHWPVLVVSPRGPRYDLLTAPQRSDCGTLETLLPPSIAARLELYWLDVTSEESHSIAPRDRAEHGKA